MMAETHQRIFLLNRLMCKSASRAPQEHKIPVPSGKELLQTIKALHDREVCVEFFDHAAEPDDFNHQARISENKGKNFIRVTAIDFQSDGAGASYCTLLLHFVDNTVRSFPVVDIAKFSGRELAGEDDERGAFAGYMMVRLPAADEYDDGTYRCVVESVTNITRQSVEYLLSRQLRRQAREEDLRHPVTLSGRTESRRPQTTSTTQSLNLRRMSDGHLLDPKPAMFGPAGFLSVVQSFLLLAVPLLIGSLGAVAMGSPGQHLDRRAVGAGIFLDGEILTLRQFVSYLLGYLCFVGLVVFIFVTIAILVQPAVLKLVDGISWLNVAIEQAGIVVMLIVFSAFAITVFWALYFLTDIVNRHE